MPPLPFDLIHCDIRGPYKLPSHFEHRCFLTLIDDCTRFTWVFLLKHKFDATTVVPKFLNLVDTQFNKKVKEFSSNNALELTFIECFNVKGVLHKFSCVEQP